MVSLCTEGMPVFSLEGISADVAQFMTGCDRLFSAMTRQTKFSETEKVMIAHYCKEIMLQTQALRDELEKK